MASSLMINPLDPAGSQIEQMAIDRQRALATALQQSGLTAPEGQMIAGRYVAPSATQYLGKIAQGLSGKSMNQALDQRQVDYQRNAMQNMLAYLRGDQGGAQAATPATPASPSMPLGSGMSDIGAPVAPSSAQPAAPQQGQSSGQLPIDRYMKARIIQSLAGDAASKSYLDQFAPTDLVKTMTAAGIDPNSPQGRQILEQNIAKSNYIAPTSGRPGGYLSYADGRQEQLPQVPEGYTAIKNQNGQWQTIRVPGALEAMADSAASKLRGKNMETVAPKEMLPTLQNGQVIPTSIDAMLHGGVAGAQSGASGLDTSKLTPQQIAYLAKTDPEAYANGVADFARTSGMPAGVGPAFGQKTVAEESAKDAVANYNNMHKFATVSAPRNIGLLQSIDQLATKTLSGPGASKAMFVNGVLNTLGIPVGADAAQNYQIMSKNLNMLVGSQRMAASGGGSDALQALLQASNPNVKEMNAPALKEAAQELVAYNRMMMASDKVLPNPNTVSPKEYAAAETRFAQFADPRLWQLEHAENDKERMRILSMIPESERNAILNKAAQARKLGILD